MHDDNDPLIGLAEGARLLGRTGRGGTPKSPATLWRWGQKGKRLPGGSVVRLRMVRVGSLWATRRSWVDEFVEATTAGALPAPEPATRTPAERRRDSEAAVAELQKLGV